MRIIHVVNVRWFNATAWYGVFLARLMADAGHDVLILALPDTPPARKARELGLAVRELPLNTVSPHGILSLLARLRSILAEFRPHVVDCHRGESFILWGLLKKLMGGFCLVRTRGDQRLPKNNLVNRWLHRSVADAVVATNSLTFHRFVQDMGLPSSRVHLIPGGVDTDRFAFDPAGRERVRAGLGLSPDHFAIGLLGRFDLVKGQKELIRAVARLVFHHGLDHVRLVLAGFPTATTREEVEGWIAESGLEDRTAITGRVDDVAACISAMDLGVVPSLWSEAIARAALEIMACKIPLVGSRVGVMGELLGPDALADPGDVEQLTALLLACATDPDLRATLLVQQSARMETLTHHAFLAQSMELFRSLASPAG